jgi:hypothetical protein
MNYRLFGKDVGTPSSSSAFYDPFAEPELGVPGRLMPGR